MRPNVLCVSRIEITPHLDYRKLHNVIPCDLNQVPDSAYQFINRDIVDTKDQDSFSFKIAKAYPQILAYVLVRCGDEYLTYARKLTGDSRLLNNRSMGFGGHVDQEDIYYCSVELGRPATYQEIIRFATAREMTEELSLSIDTQSLKFDKLIVDQSNSVGKVHVGLLCVVDVEKSDVTASLETHDLQWHTLADLNDDIQLYENWSKIAMLHQAEL